MRFRSVLSFGIVLLVAGVAVAQQGRDSHSGLVDAPEPQSAAGQQPASPDNGRTSQQQKAQEQLKEEEHQRILGVVPNFGTSYRADAVSLTAKQKLELSLRTAFDPATFAIAGLVAGFHEANDDYGGFGWGAQGYGKRFGAAYADAFDGSVIGGGILAGLLHQDPRYFRLGHGTGVHRVLYAMATTVICKHDNSRRWEPNYSNIGGNIIAGAISNLYYPSQNSGWGQTIANGMIVTVEGTGGAVFAEFWPDISRKIFHKDPTHGLDAQAAAEEQAAKRAEKHHEKQQPLPTPK